MSSTPQPVDITTLTSTDMLRLVEEINTTNTPRILKRKNKTVAMLLPVATEDNVTKKYTTRQAIDETLALAGSWHDLDFDDMLTQLDRIRHHSKPTPPIQLDI